MNQFLDGSGPILAIGGFVEFFHFDEPSWVDLSVSPPSLDDFVIIALIIFTGMSADYVGVAAAYSTTIVFSVSFS